MNNNYGMIAIMKITSVDQGFLHIESQLNLAKLHTYTNRTYRLERMHALLDHFDHPEKAYKIVHVAGSKGKGSTARMISHGLSALGYATGIYASPHLIDYRERITQNGEFFSESLLLATMQHMFSHLKTFCYNDEWGSSEPTTFELLTLLALLVFKKAGCQWVVLETGLGGRLDATNVVTPEVSVITALELEHTEILGNTIETIASEKGGIIKEKVPCVVGFQPFPEARDTLTNIAAERYAPMIDVATMVSTIESKVSKQGTTTKVRWIQGTQETLNLSLRGAFQGENALVALTTIEQLLHPTKCERMQIIAGIEKATFPGRCQFIAENPDILIDPAHTAKSIDGILDTWNTLYPKSRHPEGGILIFGAVLGKNHQAMAEQLIPHFSHIIISTPGTFKQSDPASLAELFRSLGANPILELDPAQALQRALALSVRDEKDSSRATLGDTSATTQVTQKPILVTGSFYMISEIVKSFQCGTDANVWSGNGDSSQVSASIGAKEATHVS